MDLIKVHQQTGLCYFFIGLLCFIVILFTALGLMCLRKYRSMARTIQELQSSKLPSVPVPPPCPAVEEVPPFVPLRPTTTFRPPTRRLWKARDHVPLGPSFSKSDLNLLQLIKAGKEGIYYQARMNKGTCKGHNMFTCKISKEGVRAKHLDTEVSIMRKLVHHKNILQLLDWNTAQEPYMLIMEYVNYGTLRTYLQANRSDLSADPELQSLLTIASYHIALALQHLRSKMIVHCDLALRNIMVSKFPWEVKLAEFSLARDLTRITSCRSSRCKNPRQRVPLRWYPPEYFKNNYYSFKGDVWAFGIVLWEMQTFGTLPYPNMETSESVVHHICTGHKNMNPEGCRQEILHIMQECWLEPYIQRPSFTDIVRMLEDIMESDADYVDVESPEIVVKDEAEYHEAKSPESPCVDTFTKAPE